MTDEKDNGPHATPPRRRPKPAILEIAGKRLKPSTLMMGHGFDPALSEGALKPPIFLTSTFVFENAAAGKRHFEGVTGVRPGGAEGLVYSCFIEIGSASCREGVCQYVYVWGGAVPLKK